MAEAEQLGTDDTSKIEEAKVIETTAPRYEAPRNEAPRNEAPSSGVPFPPPAPAKRSAWWPVLGGVVAALAGYSLAQVVPNGWPVGADTTLQTQLAAEVVQVQALKAQLLDLGQRLDAAAASTDRVAKLQAAPAPKGVDVAALEARIAGLEARPTTGADPAALAQLRSDVEALKANGAGIVSPAVQASLNAKVSETEAKLALIEAAAKTASAATMARAAVRQIAAALDSGAPYTAAVADIAGADLPAVLADHAATGLPTLQGLQADFPAAARTALDAALRANMGESWSARVANFLRAQTGARALTPRQGTDPDAVLSRAEAAIAKGDLATALKEIAALPPAGLAAMADWQAKAQRRLDAEAAVLALLAKAG